MQSLRLHESRTEDTMRYDELNPSQKAMVDFINAKFTQHQTPISDIVIVSAFLLNKYKRSNHER